MGSGCHHFNIIQRLKLCVLPSYPKGQNPAKESYGLNALTTQLL